MIVAMRTFNLADLFELVVDAASDREAVVTPERRLTFAQLDDQRTASQTICGRPASVSVTTWGSSS